MPKLDEGRLKSAVGERIKQLRTQAGLSQEDLADKLGLLRTSITNIETGKQKLTLASLYSLSATFNLTFDEILPPVEGFIQKDPLDSFDANKLKDKNRATIDKYLRGE